MLLPSGMKSFADSPSHAEDQSLSIRLNLPLVVVNLDSVCQFSFAF